MKGPKPETDREYLIEIYNILQNNQEEIKTLCDRVCVVEADIETLKKTNSHCEGFERGKQDWWNKYKGLIQTGIAALLALISGIIISNMGVK